MQQYLKSPVMGQMMDQPLLISSIIRHVDHYFGSVEVVSRLSSGKLHHYTYHDCHRRARRLAKALVGLGVRIGDRVATLAWNGYRHLEAYFAIPGAGMVLHTINPRLHPDQIAYIADHAEDQYILFDLSFLAQAEVIAERCAGTKGFIALCSRSEMPSESKIANLICYEDLWTVSPTLITNGQYSTNTQPLVCATPRARRAIPREHFTHTVRQSCILMQKLCPTRSIFRHATS